MENSSGYRLSIRAHGSSSMRGRGRAVVAVMILAACGEVAGGLPTEAGAPDAGAQASFQTDSATYTLHATSTGYEGDIGVVFTNPGPAPVYVVNCNGATGWRLERWTSGAWRSVWSPILPACLSEPIVIQGRAQYRVVARISDCGFLGACAPRLTDLPRGEPHRLVWTLFVTAYDARGPSWGSPLPDERRTSNTFTLRTAAK